VVELALDLVQAAQSSRSSTVGPSESSMGEVPTSSEQMGRNAVAFIKALGIQQVDVL
jgi:hypothetical protein